MGWGLNAALLYPRSFLSGLLLQIFLNENYGAIARISCPVRSPLLCSFVSGLGAALLTAKDWQKRSSYDWIGDRMSFTITIQWKKSSAFISCSNMKSLYEILESGNL